MIHTIEKTKLNCIVTYNYFALKINTKMGIFRAILIEETNLMPNFQLLKFPEKFFAGQNVPRPYCGYSLQLKLFINMKETLYRMCSFLQLVFV